MARKGAGTTRRGAPSTLPGPPGLRPACLQDDLSPHSSWAPGSGPRSALRDCRPILRPQQRCDLRLPLPSHGAVPPTPWSGGLHLGKGLGLSDTFISPPTPTARHSSPPALNAPSYCDLKQVGTAKWTRLEIPPTSRSPKWRSLLSTVWWCVRLTRAVFTGLWRSPRCSCPTRSMQACTS